MAGNTPSKKSGVSSQAQPVYLINALERDDSIDLIDLIDVLWQRKWFIAAVTAVVGLVGIGYAFLATPIYRAEVVLAPAQSEQMPNIPSSLSGLAGLAGITLGSSSDSNEALATLRSRALVEEFILDNNLMPTLFSDEWDDENQRWRADDHEEQPQIPDAIDYFVEDIRTVREENTAGLVTLQIDWSDPELAAAWAAELVDRVNERLRARDLGDSERRIRYLNQQLEASNIVELRQAISRLIEEQMQTVMMAKAEAEYAFKVIDPPRVPIDHVAPNRPLVVIVAVLLGVVIGSIAALFRWAWQTRRASDG